MSLKLSDFGSKPLNDGVDTANLPEQGGSYPDPPQPGAYRFDLSPLTLENFEKVASNDYGERVKVKFDANAPLVITQSPTGAENGTPYQTSISNVPRKRGRGDDAPVASDMDYLVMKGLGIPMPTPRTNQAYVKALLEASAKKASFIGDIEWSWNCNDGRDAYFLLEDGSTGPIDAVDAQGTPTGGKQQGCGKRVYQKDVQKVTHDAAGTQLPAAKYPMRITCAGCGASVRGFSNIRTFRPATK